MEAPSCGLYVHRNGKLWWLTLDQWMDGAGVKAHSAVKPYHLYAFTWMNLHPTMRLKFDAILRHLLPVRVQSPMLSPFAIV